MDGSLDNGEGVDVVSFIVLVMIMLIPVLGLVMVGAIQQRRQLRIEQQAFDETYLTEQEQVLMFQRGTRRKGRGNVYR